MTEVNLRHSLQREIKRRHDRSDGDRVDRPKVNAASANRLRACMPYSSAVRSAPSLAPVRDELFAVVHTERSIRVADINNQKHSVSMNEGRRKERLKNGIQSSSRHPHRFLNRIARRARAVLATDATANLPSFARVVWITHQFFQSRRRPTGVVSLAWECTRDAETCHARGVVRLVMAEGHDQHRLAGAQRLCGCANAALMHDGRRARQKLAVRSVIEGRDSFGQRLTNRQIACVTGQQHRAAMSAFAAVTLSR